MRLEQWRVGVLPFTSAADVNNPFLDVCIMAEFTGPSGRTIKREAYWDGGRSYKVSFAPTELGVWNYTLTAPSETGLDGVTGSLECVPYIGELPIYQHGFLKIGGQGRYLAHADDTPFFWLGDTHWGFVIREPWDIPEDGDYSCTFPGMVDLRWDQGFTVYQSNLRTDGFFGVPTKFWVENREDDLPNVTYYQTEVDRRMQYIADKGFVNALGLSWFHMVLNGGLARQKNLARYIVARYGALPIVWTLAGEVAGYQDRVRQELIDSWREVALLIEQLDGYGTLQTAHYTNERPFAEYYQEESWFDFTMNQAGHGDFPICAKDFRAHRAKWPDKPFVESEAFYEFLISLEEHGGRMITADMLRRVAYIAIQCGGCGYTYGTFPSPTKKQMEKQKPQSSSTGAFRNGNVPWEDMRESDGVKQLGYMRAFYEQMGFARLRPYMGCLRSQIPFTDDTLFGMFNPFITASEDMSTVVMYMTRQSQSRGSVIRFLKDRDYQAIWFNPRTGVYSEPMGFHPVCGEYVLPERPDSEDWLLVLQEAEGTNG